MSNDPLKFWMTCPACKHPFGVEPRAILQYLNRVLDAKMDERAEKAEKPARAIPPAPAGNPTPSTPKAPYKPPYRKWKR